LARKQWAVELGNEILVAFSLGCHKSNAGGGHAIDPARPQVTAFARSLDGGESWQLEQPVIPTDRPSQGNVNVKDDSHDPAIQSMELLLVVNFNLGANLDWHTRNQRETESWLDRIMFRKARLTLVL